MGVICPTIALLAALAPSQPALPVVEGFEGDLGALREQGWKLPPTCSLGSESPRSGAQCLKVEVSSGRERYAELFIPVTPGKFYRAEAWVRCADVQAHAEAGQNRGAVIFLQWADASKGWVGGGSFPVGLHGTHDWTLREVPYTREIPPEVAYVQLLLGVEGAGTAWFDDVRVEEITAWPGAKVLTPGEGTTVDTALPLLRWQAEPKVSYQVHLSPNPDFPPGDTVTLAGGDGEARPEQALAPGRWYWRVQELIGGKLPPGAVHSFTVPPGAPAWPPTIEPGWLWTDSPRPVLRARLQPWEDVREVEVWVDEGEAEVVSFKDGRLRFRPAADVSRGVHTVTIRALGDGERSLETRAVFCNKTPGSRVTLDQHNRLIVDGEPFFPLGAYRDPSDTITDFSGLIEAGFNLTHSYSFEDTEEQAPQTARQYLEAAHRHGLKVFLGLHRGRFQAGDLEWCQRWVAELMDCPALLTWYLFDEPAAHGIPVQRMEQARRAIKAVDPFHPLSTVFCQPREFAAYAGATDIFWNDPYPVPSRPLTMVEEWVRLGREAAGPNKPVWTVLGAHDIRYWSAPQQAMEALGKPARPTPEETRRMAFLALAAGADGLIWYWGPNGIYHMQNDAPAVWAGLCETVHELRGLMRFLTAPRGPSDAVEVVDPFRAWSRAAEGKRVLAVVNSADAAATLDLDLRALGAREVSLRKSGEAVPLAQGKLNTEFGPYEVRVYEWATAP